MKIIYKQAAWVTGGVLLSINTMAYAAGDDKVSVHGYGDYAVLRATEINYTKRYNGTKWDYNYLSLNVNAQIDEKTKIVAQIRQGSEIVGDMSAYVNYNVTDNTTARVGQMTVPFGIFNELRDIKFLQLSVLSPLMYQDAAGTLPDTFKGVEAIFHVDRGNHRVTFDLYGGEPKSANNYVIINQDSTSNYWFLVQNIYGGRITYKTPIGLKFSVSAFQNDLLTSTTPLATTTLSASSTPGGSGIRRLAGASADYRGSNLDFKMEYNIAYQFEGTPLEQRGTSYYAQIGYTIAEKYTPFFRYDSILYNNKQPDNPAYYQKVKVLGVSYKLNNNVSIRMENHWNNGYAIPNYAQDGTLATSPSAKLDWNIFAMGMNFIF